MMMKKIVLIKCFVIFIVASATSQVDTIWTKTLGGTGNESTTLLNVEWSVPLIDVDTAGNMYVVGRSDTVSGDIHKSLGGEDCWIIKLNANGDTLWTKVFGGSADDIPADILVLDNGDFIVAGYTFSDDIDLTGNHGDEDGFVTRFDSSGNVIWSKLYGGGLFLGQIPGHDIIKGITLLSNGNLLAVGNTNSNNGDLPQDLTKFGAAWILRIDTANGNLLNTEKVVGPNHDEYTPNLFISASELLDSSGYYAFGETRYGIQPYRMWLVKFDNNDNMLWNKEFGSATDNNARYVIAMPNNEAMISGNIYYADGDVSNWYGGMSDIWIALVDSNQNIITEKTFGGSQGVESLYVLKKVNNNSYVFGGSALSTDNYLHQNLGASDFWLVNFDNNLDTNWTYDFGGSNSDRITGLISDNNGNIFVSGRTESNDLYVHNNHGGQDIFIAKLQDAFASRLNDMSNKNESVSIYPNPASYDFLITVNNSLNEYVYITLFNSLGQKVKQLGQLNETVITKKIDVSDYDSGIYFINIRIGDRVETQKIIIEKK